MAQQQKTSPQEINLEELEPLTDQETYFCRLICEGRTAAAAYRQAFDPLGKLADTTVWTKASMLKNSEKVRVWLYAATQAGFMDSKVTLEGHLEELARLREAARASGNMGAAVQAEQLRGKVAGHYVERIKDETERLDDSELVDVIRKILGDKVADEAILALGQDEARH